MKSWGFSFVGKRLILSILVRLLPEVHSINITIVKKMAHRAGEGLRFDLYKPPSTSRTKLTKYYI